MEKITTLDCPVYFDRTNILDMLSLSAGRAILCQNRMGSMVIGGNNWGLDPMNGIIRFGDREFTAGILGSESDIQNTWLWSWAHTESGLPERVTALSHRAKKTLPQLAEFQTGKFMRDEMHTGHILSMIACGALNDNLCYYRCPYDGCAGGDIGASGRDLRPRRYAGIHEAVYRHNQRVLLRPSASCCGLPLAERHSVHRIARSDISQLLRQESDVPF